MIENAQKMSCGGCGEAEFHIYTQGERSDRKLHVECRNCKSVTVITTEPSSLRLDFGDDSMGRLCVMPKRGNPRK